MTTNGSNKHDHSPKSPETAERRWLRPVIAIAACACLAFALIPIAGGGFFGKNRTEKDPDENGLYSFSGYKELERTLDEILEDQQYLYNDLKEETMDLAEAPGSTATGADGPSAQTGGNTDKSGYAPMTDGQETDHSTTYNQVEGVDEGDVVKTDGKYIYHVSYMENSVIITEAHDGKTKRVSSVGVDGDRLIDDIYIQGDRLMVISETRTPVYYVGGDVTIDEDGSSYVDKDETVPSTIVTCYDISDRSDPRKTDSYTQSGAPLSSRMTGGNILLVTCQNVYTGQKKGRIPTVAFGDEEAKDLDISHIQCIPSPATATYTIVGMIDPSGDKIDRKTAKTRAVLGGSEQIYCSTDELYITANVYKGKGRDSSIPWIAETPMSFEQETRILKVDFSDKKLTYSAIGTVSGIANDQFSMDARDGYFRIATTAQSEKGDTNNLFILDKDLKEVGSLSNFARDEHIEAVRYIGDSAYVITYEQIDPLFIIDLSDPKDPQIKGHVKISGFSTFLVPVDEDHVLGFGFATETTETGEAADGLKLALFDVSDPAKPKVADAMSFANVSSEIQYEHRALLVGPKGSYYAIPYDRFSDDWIEDGNEMFDDAEGPDETMTRSPEEDPVKGDEGIDKGRKGNAKYDNGIMVFDARGGKLKLEDQLKSDASVKRCIYIGDFIYAICIDDNIKGYKR